MDELALIRDTIRHYAPVLIAPLSIQIRRAGVQKKFVGPHLGKEGVGLGTLFPELWPLAIIGAVTLAAASWMFRNRLA